MILKKERKKQKKKGFFFFNKFLYFYFFSTFSIFLILFIFVITSYKANQKLATILDHFSKAGRYEYINIFNIGFNAFKSNFYDIERLDLNINFEDILILENFRNQSIKNKSLGNSENIPTVNGDFIYKSKNSKSKIRLKGERMLHYLDKKHSSYKVELERDRFISGVNRFSLQKPRVRNYIHEWLLHELSGEKGLIKLKYKFLKFYINGSSQGLYVLEESFGKELIERNNRRYGPIFALDDNMINFETNFKVNEDDPFFEVYNQKFWNRTENKKILDASSKKIRDFLNGNLSLEETFDLDLFAKFFAIIDLTYNYHAISPGALRLYYNPISGLFEPIPFDGQRENPNFNKYNLNYDNQISLDMTKVWWVKKFFQEGSDVNKSFYKKYLHELSAITSNKFIEKFFDSRDYDIKRINSFIYSDYFYYTNGYDFGPGLYYYSKKDLLHRVKVIKGRINSEKANIQVIQNSEKEFKIQVFFKNCLSCEKNKTYSYFSTKKILCNYDNGEYIAKKEFAITKPLDIYQDTYVKLDEINENYKCTHIVFINEINNKKIIKEINNLNSTKKLISYNNFKSGNYKKFFFNQNDKLFLKNDYTKINENLFIPKNYEVIISPGQSLILIDNAFIISESPFLLIGNQDDKIILSGEKNNFGGGLLIKKTNKKSIFKNVEISYLTGIKDNFFVESKKIIIGSNTKYLGKSKNDFKENFKILNPRSLINEYILLGSLNFYQTNVELFNLQVKRISSEDAINVINSNFMIDGVHFIENGSDAIDFDFSNGTIKNSIFEYIGNDAIDFSGSSVLVKNISFNTVGDKVISAGENSKIDILNISAEKSYVGIAAKDGSMVTAKDVKMDEVKIPFSAYNKKYEYNIPSLILERVELNNFTERWIVDKKSNIFYENNKVGKIIEDIFPTIYRKSLNVIQDES